MIKAVFWDNDGVLVDTEKLYFKATREVLSEIGVDLTTELFAQISLKQGRSVFAHLYKSSTTSRFPRGDFLKSSSAAGGR